MINTLKTQLTIPALVDRFQATFTKAFNEANSGEASRERKEMEKELAVAENRVTPEGPTYRITGGFDLSLGLDDYGTPGPEGDRGVTDVYDRKGSGGVI